METTTYTVWTNEAIFEVAKQYKSRSAWEKGDSRSYGAAHRRNIVDEACKHMEEIRKPRGYWTPARVMEDALKYTSKTDWNRESFTAYRTAKFLRIFDRCVTHMDKTFQEFEKVTKKEIRKELAGSKK